MSDNTIEIANAVRHALHSARQTIERLTRENAALSTDNYRLKRELGKARLLTDLRRDVAEFELSADDQIPALLRRQAE